MYCLELENRNFKEVKLKLCCYVVMCVVLQCQKYSYDLTQPRKTLHEAEHIHIM